MHRRISEVDITNYVLNELEPRERLFVESMMVGCENSRADALAMMEMARLLEEGMDLELAGLDLSLDEERKSKVFAFKPDSPWKAVAKVSAAVAALAACIGFSVAAPLIARIALNPESALVQISRAVSQGAEALEESDIVDPGAFPVVSGDLVEAVDSLNSSIASDDFPTRVLLPTGTVNFVEMPMPNLGGEAN